MEENATPAWARLLTFYRRVDMLDLYDICTTANLAGVTAFTINVQCMHVPTLKNHPWIG